MPWLLHRLAEALFASTFLELAGLPSRDLENARNEFLAARQIQSGLYEQGTKILDDRNAFGLKFGTRLSEESDYDEIAFQILMFANLRRNTDAFVSREKIQEMAEQIKSQVC